MENIIKIIEEIFKHWWYGIVLIFISICFKKIQKIFYKWKPRAIYHIILMNENEGLSDALAILRTQNHNQNPWINKNINHYTWVNGNISNNSHNSISVCKIYTFNFVKPIEGDYRIKIKSSLWPQDNSYAPEIFSWKMEENNSVMCEIRFEWHSSYNYKIKIIFE